MEAQLQIRQNVEETREFVDGLLAWQKELESTASKPRSASEADVPGVRGRASTVSAALVELQRPALQSSSRVPTAASRQIQTSASTQRDPAAHTYKNYTKWEGFDVDAALEACDQAPLPAPQPRQPATTPTRATASSSAASQGPTPHPLDCSANAIQPSSAGGWKDRGNQLFQAGHYQEALRCYEKSLSIEPNCLAHANSAMAYLKLNEPAEAEAACSRALQLDPTYVKAYQRRGTARRALGQLLEAAEDYEAALRLEPSSQSLRADRDACLNQYLQQEKLEAVHCRPRQLPVSMAAPSAAVPAPAPAASGAAAGLGGAAAHSSSGAGATTAPAAAAAALQACLPHGIPSSSSGGRSEISPHVGPSQTPHTPASAPLPGAKLQSSGSGSSNQQQPAGSQAAATQPGPAKPAAAAAAGTGGRFSPSPTSPQASPGQAAAAAQKAQLTPAASSAASRLAGRVLAQLKPPRTSVEFEAAWRALRGDARPQAEYLSWLKPQELPNIFKQSLTAAVLVDIATTALGVISGGLVSRGSTAAAEQGNEASGSSPAAAPAATAEDKKQLTPASAVELLGALCTVPRFDMALMCCTSSQRKQIRDAWDAPCEGGNVPLALGLQGQLGALRAKYKV